MYSTLACMDCENELCNERSALCCSECQRCVSSAIIRFCSQSHEQGHASDQLQPSNSLMTCLHPEAAAHVEHSRSPAAAGRVPWDRLLPNTNVVSASVLPSCSVSSMNAPPRAAAAPTAAPHSARWAALSRSMLLTNACSCPPTSDTARSSCIRCQEAGERRGKLGTESASFRVIFLTF